jgi:hypothetical protein
VEIISLGFETITWFPSYVAHDMCGIASFGAINLEKPTLQKILISTIKPYGWPSFQSLALLD